MPVKFHPKAFNPTQEWAVFLSQFIRLRDKMTYNRKSKWKAKWATCCSSTKKLLLLTNKTMQQATEMWFQIKGHTIKSYKWQRFQTQLLHTNAPFTWIKEFQGKCLPKTWNSDIHSIWWFCYFACSIIYQPRGEKTNHETSYNHMTAFSCVGPYILSAKTETSSAITNK